MLQSIWRMTGQLCDNGLIKVFVYKYSQTNLDAEGLNPVEWVKSLENNTIIEKDFLWREMK